MIGMLSLNIIWQGISLVSLFIEKMDDYQEKTADRLKNPIQALFLDQEDDI
jgi:hypothetical protein